MKRDDLFAGYEQGQADMLAKCIAAVSDTQTATYPGEFSDGYDLAYAECRSALRALQEKQ